MTFYYLKNKASGMIPYRGTKDNPKMNISPDPLLMRLIARGMMEATAKTITGRIELEVVSIELPLTMESADSFLYPIVVSEMITKEGGKRDIVTYTWEEFCKTKAAN